MINFEMLWKYQQTDAEVESLKKELDNTPERLKLKKLRRVLTEQTDRIKGFETGLRDKEAEIEAKSRELEDLLRSYDLEQEELNIMLDDEEATSAELAESRKAMEQLLDRINSLKKALSAGIEWTKRPRQTSRRPTPRAQSSSVITRPQRPSSIPRRWSISPSSKKRKGSWSLSRAT